MTWRVSVEKDVRYGPIVGDVRPVRVLDWVEKISWSRLEVLESAQDSPRSLKQLMASVAV